MQGLKVCDVRSALFLLKATKEFKEKSSTLARCLAERMGLPEASLALPWDAPVHRSGRLEWDLGGMRFTMPSTFPPKASCALHTWDVTTAFNADSLWLTCRRPLAPAVLSP
jgi:hypothetical protein